MRLASYLDLSEPTRLAILSVLAVLCAMVVVAMPLLRLLPKKVVSIFAWVVYAWMGILLISFVAVLISDIILLISYFIPGINPGSQLFQHRLAYMVIICTILVSAKAIWNVLRPVTIKSLSITLDNLPKQLEGIRIVQITDLHIGPTISGRWLKQVVEKVNVLNPDIVAITGDLVDGSVSELYQHVSHLSDLRARNGVYFVTGNHEYYSGVEQWVEYLRALGITVLRNEKIKIADSEGNSLYIAGVDDYHSPRISEGSNLSLTMGGRDENIPVVLLAHQPAHVVEAASYGVDLQLSGHTHGGQIWPFNYLVLLQQPYINGLHKHKNTNTQIYISNGTGYWGPPMRLGAQAEITNITLLSRK